MKFNEKKGLSPEVMGIVMNNDPNQDEIKKDEWVAFHMESFYEVLAKSINWGIDDHFWLQLRILSKFHP